MYRTHSKQTAMAGLAIGMMNEAYFRSRTELLDWANTTFALNLSKVEECCTGAFHCQVFDRVYPGKLPMAKVNFAAKHDYEYLVKRYSFVRTNRRIFINIGR